MNNRQAQLLLTAARLTPGLFRLQLQTEIQTNPGQRTKAVLKAIRNVAVERKLHIGRILGDQPMFMEMNKGRYYRPEEMQWES